MTENEEFCRFRAFMFNMLMSLKMFEVYANTFREDFEKMTKDKEFKDYSPLEHDIHDMMWHVGDITKSSKTLRKLYEWYFIENKGWPNGDIL